MTIPNAYSQHVSFRDSVLRNWFTMIIMIIQDTMHTCIHVYNVLLTGSHKYGFNVYSHLKFVTIN